MNECSARASWSMYDAAENHDQTEESRTMPQMSTTIDQLCQRLESCGQRALSHYLQGVTPAKAQNALAEQIQAIDLDDLQTLIERYVTGYQSPPTPGSVKPAPYYALDGTGPSGMWAREEYQAKGEQLIKAGKVACFTVAGGQGSRLGYDGPKGCYPTSCVNEKSLFQLFAESIRKNELKHDCVIPWYIMTSPLNHEATVSFFEQHDSFGLQRDQIMFFKQGVMPSLDAQSGDMLLSDPMHLATNPDGHGGSFKALHTSGAIDDMKRRGVEHISYFQVDNPHSNVVDPVFLGLHAYAPDSSGEFSSKMVSKAMWDEKVGVFCDVDGATQVIEYSDLDENLAKQTEADGRLSFNAGSIAIHVIGVAFIERVLGDADAALPYHRALKKVPYFDIATGRPVAPDANNAVKLEKFVFDAIPIAKRSIVVETDRIEEFAPVKNATGTDSIESSKKLQSVRAARWLKGVGVTVPMNSDGTADATIEISPLTAVCPGDLTSVDLPESIQPGETVVL
ncbi:MAG: UTP--glucose-1-phosphate uridylyltransferase [Phycisphaerales bacterium JB047]